MIAVIFSVKSAMVGLPRLAINVHWASTTIWIVVLALVLTVFGQTIPPDTVRCVTICVLHVVEVKVMSVYHVILSYT